MPAANLWKSFDDCAKSWMLFLITRLELMICIELSDSVSATLSCSGSMLICLIMPGRRGKKSCVVVLSPICHRTRTPSIPPEYSIVPDCENARLKTGMWCQWTSECTGFLSKKFLQIRILPRTSPVAKQSSSGWQATELSTLSVSWVTKFFDFLSMT